MGNDGGYPTPSHPTPYTLHPTLKTLNSKSGRRITVGTLHPKPHTLRPKPYPLHPTHYNLIFKPWILNQDGESGPDFIFKPPDLFANPAFSIRISFQTLDSKSGPDFIFKILFKPWILNQDGESLWIR